MLVDLIRTMTADGLRLDGALWPARPQAGVALPVDAALVIHGTGSNFYGSTLLDALAGAFAEWGVPTLVANTRGHDIISTAWTTDGPRLAGATHEIVDDCRHDLAAWTKLLAERGLARVALVGHSLGAVKAIYALSEGALPNVRLLVAVSPPSISHARFARGARRETFLADLAAAQAYLARGEGESLIPIRFPLPYVITAAGYVDKYGPAERYEILVRLPRVAVPTLVVYGSQELRHNPAFEGLAETVEALDPKRARIAVEVIAEADHFYTGLRDALAARVARWLKKQVSAG